MGRIVGYLLIYLILQTIALDLLQLDGLIVDITFHLLWVTALVGFAHVIVKQKMSVFVLKRSFEALLTVFVIATVTFLLLRTIPGGPFDSDKALPPEIVANINAKYNLDKPLIQQYLIYITDLFRGDLGYSYKYIGRSVSDIIAESFPASFKLGFYSLIIAYLFGIPLGLYAAARHNTWWDSFLMFIANSGVALPSFLVAPILIIIFSFWLHWLPPALWDGPIYYIMPVITLGIRPAAVIARLTRSSVLDVIRSDFIRTAKSKGLSEKVVLYKHVLRNSLIPVLTMSGPLIAGLLSGTFVIEIIFAVPGMGKHFVQSVSNRDYPLILGLTLLYSAILVAANLLVDLLYAIVDPRIKLS
ncbi:MAG: ABC transporter permease [Bdellovibrionales bacterium]|nr:ABC transporter permease [Bdellovibrionales bacterium]